MIIVYRTKPSESARTLTETLARCRRAMSLDRRPPVNGDGIVCWGESLNPINGVKILNGSPLINKLQAAEKLKAAGVPTVEVSRTRVANQVGVRPPLNLGVAAAAGILTEVDARRLLQQLNTYLTAPVPPASIWLPRRFNHVGGNDLLHPPAEVQYWSKKESLIEEYRVHCFLGKSIRAGVKIKNENDQNHHEWIRSLDGGWRISYDGFNSTKAMRKLAIDSLKALNLEFGAVDIGKKADGGLIVLEVNRAPGVEGGTIDAYARAIEKWYNGENEMEAAA